MGMRLAEASAVMWPGRLCPVWGGAGRGLCQGQVAWVCEREQ